MVEAPESREQKEEIVLATFEDHINVLRQPRTEDEPALSLLPSLFLSLSLDWFHSTILNLPTRNTRLDLHLRRAECIILRSRVKASFGCSIAIFCEIQADRGRYEYNNNREHVETSSTRINDR